MSKLISIVSIFIVSATAFAQFGGGSAAFTERSRSGADEARANELAKRNVPFGDGRFIDASVLMNVKPDEYVAVFGISEEGITLALAQSSMDATIRTFMASLKGLNISAADTFVDFVAQNRIYGYDVATENLAKEVVVGFEVKKNVSIRYKDYALLDKLIAAASKSEIFDLVKVDYVVKDIAASRKRIMEEAAKVIKTKMEEQEQLLGIKMGQPIQVMPSPLGVYYPVEMYDSYVAEESEEVYAFRQGMTVHRARKPRTFYYNPLAAKDFDVAVNPSLIEPAVQFAIYVRVKY
ncbi:MAG: SIMPL domain-containing protein [Armatimonadota bacterium]|nr:SIMPL domain-containing protein [Armatimonadota bacterium]